MDSCSNRWRVRVNPTRFCPWCIPEKPEGEPGEYYVPGTFDVVKHMIKRLQNKTILKGRNVFFDRLCTSIPLIHLLLSQGITSIRTLMLTGREYLKKSRPYAVKTRPTHYSGRNRRRNLSKIRTLLWPRARHSGMYCNSPPTGYAAATWNHKRRQAGKTCCLQPLRFHERGTDIVDQRILFIIFLQLSQIISSSWHLQS